MRSYDGIDSNAFMNSNGNYRVQAYMVQPFFEEDEGGFLPDHPTMQYVPLENEGGLRANYRNRERRVLRKLREKLYRERIERYLNIYRSIENNEKGNINNKETSQ